MAARRLPEHAASVKTTVDLPEDVWRAAKIRAMDDRVDLRTVVIAALKAYLKLNGGKDDKVKLTSGRA